jgi:GT2 family glycosyltransferase
MKCADESCIERIYVVDNSATDALKNIVMPLSSKIEYIQGHGNIGYGAGHNIALQKAESLGSDYHVVLNPDIQFDSGTIEKLVRFSSSHDNIGMVMPNVVYPDGRQQYLCKLLPTPMDMFGRRLLPKKLIEKRNERFEMRSTGYKDIRNVPCLSGCFMFLNMEIVKKVGLFDDSFFMYFEDFDLIRRLHQVSKTVFYPKLTIVHNHATEHRTNKKLLKISIQSAIRYFNKWGWFFDAERKKWNQTAFDESNIIRD